MVKLSMVIILLTLLGNNSRLAVATLSKKVSLVEISASLNCFNHGSIVIVSGLLAGDIELECRSDENLILQVSSGINSRNTKRFALQKGTKVILPREDYDELLHLVIFRDIFSAPVCTAQIVLR